MNRRSSGMALSVALTGLGLSASAFASEGGAVYSLRVEADKPAVVHVTAILPISEPILSLGGRHPQPEERRWSDYVDALQITTSSGERIAYEKTGDNQWSLGGVLGQEVRLAYRVRLEHARAKWPPSSAEATFIRDDCIFFRNWAVLIDTPGLASGRVNLDVPEDWSVTTPMHPVTGRSREYTDDGAQLQYSGMLLGTQQTGQVEVDRIRVDVGLAHDLPGAMPSMIVPFEEALREAVRVFGGAPASRYAVIGAHAPALRQGMAGSGMGNGMAVLLDRNPVDHPGGYWSYVLIHELLHMWTGGALRNRASRDEQWFEEGMTDYLTMVIAGRKGLIRQGIQLYHMGAMWSGYHAQAGEVSISDAGREKRRYYNFIYGGGLYTGLLLDIELRRATDGKRRIDDLMQALYRDFGVTGKDIASHDVERATNELAGRDLSWIFERFVRGKDMLTAELVFEPVGILLEEGNDGNARLTIDGGAKPEAAELRSDTLGMK